MFIVPSLSITAIYFDRNKGKAMSMITSSFGFGALYMAPVLRVLFSEYGYSGTLIILGGLVLHFSAAGLLYRPLKTTSYMITEVIGTEDENDKPSTEMVLKNEKVGSYSDLPLKAGWRAQEPLLKPEGDARTKSPTRSQNSIVRSQNLYKSQEAAMSTGRKISACVKVKLAIKQGLRSVVSELGLHMLADVQFLLLGFTMSSIAWTMTNSWTMAAGLAREKNFTTSQVTLLLVVVAAAELPCRLASGFIFDIAPLRKLRPIMFAFVAFVVGVTNSSLPLVQGVVPTFVVWAIMMGLLGE